MLKFKKTEIGDIDVFKKYIGGDGEFSCESAFVNLLVWQSAYNNMWAEEDGHLIIKSGNGENSVFRLPFGENFHKGIELIREYCGKEYEPKDRKTKYCSKECAMLASRKVQRPSKAELKALLLQFSMTDIARIYGVTDNAIRRWCEMYKLPQRLKGIKALREKEAAKALEKQRNEEAKQRQKAARKLQKQREKLK